ncbi:MAG: hypothetical protein IJ438_13960 [Clostridia bacterium]|nr:hypothetical protein [Clostridia bacterium]
MSFGSILLLIIIVACVFTLSDKMLSPKKGSSKTDAASFSGDDSVAAPKADKVQISKNIYGAVETFATLCHMWKKNTGWPYESLDFAWIRVEYTDEKTSLEMHCRGDCMALQVPDQFPELKADSDNIVVYKSSEVHSLNPNNPQALWTAFKDGSPNAVLEDISATPGNIFILIKFDN